MPPQKDMLDFKDSNILSTFLDDTVVTDTDFDTEVMFLDDKEVKISNIDDKEKKQILMSFDMVSTWRLMAMPKNEETFDWHFKIQQKRARANLKLNSSVGGFFMKNLNTRIQLQGTTRDGGGQDTGGGIAGKLKGLFKT